MRSQWLRSQNWIPSVDLLSGHALIKQDPWRTLQITHFLLSLPQPPLFLRKLHSFKELCLGAWPICCFLSTSYKVLDVHTISDRFIVKWESLFKIPKNIYFSSCISLLFVVNIRRLLIKYLRTGKGLCRF